MAQKNILKYILLGMLELEKKTGYDLKRMFDYEIGEFWAVKHSQIYLELKRLEQDGYITSEKGFYGNKIEKTYYTITEKGLEKLDKWRNSPSDEIVISKDEFIMKLYFIHDKEDERIGRMLYDQLIMHRRKLEHLRERMEEVFPDLESREGNYGHYLILDRAIDREEEYVRWLEAHTS